MSNTMEELYDLINLGVSNSCNYREELRALAKARLALLEELHQVCGDEGKALWDVITSLEGECQKLHEQALFQATLELGMELGRLGA